MNTISRLPAAKERVRSIALLVIGVVLVASLSAIAVWGYFGAGRDPASWCGARNGGREYTCVNGATPRGSAVRGCEASGGSYDVIQWRCAVGEP